jgi:ribosomal protein L20
LHTLSLTCRIVWIDPAIDKQTRDAMEAYLERHKRQRRHRNIWIRILTWIAIALLAFNLLSGLLGGRAGFWF